MSHGIFSNCQNTSEGLPYSWDEDPSSSEDSVTRLLENSLDCRRTKTDQSGMSDDMFAVTTAETCLIKYPGQVVLSKESRI